MGRRRHRSSDRRGQALTEFAVVLPIVLLMLLGVVEFGHAFGTVHAMAGLSREGANLAARGTSLDTVAAIVLNNGSDIGLTSNGGAVVSQIQVQAGVPTITSQSVVGPYASLLGGVGEAAGQGIGEVGFINGSTHYAVELFSAYDPITPLANLIEDAVPDPLYERTIF